jgi:arylsulfatase A-like enzyme/Flp pilus assembly protein TadD
VLITLDTTRADRLGVMGDERARTPTLDALATRGVLFERAYASAPLTLPSHASILTGLDPNLHGIHDNGRFAVRRSLETVAERLSARGYATAAFVSAFVLDSVFGLDQGFDVYDDETDPVGDPFRFAVPSRRGEEVTSRALAWLAETHRRPFFLWTHYYDVHAPRQPPPPFDELGDPYRGELAYVDAQLQPLLEGVTEAGGKRETLVIVVGDHGESLGQHDELTHGVLAYDSSLHVPLIVVGPGFPAGLRSRRFVRTIDVASTILAALDEPPPPESQARPLQQRLAEQGESQILGYFECFAPEYGMGWSRIGGIRTERWKYTAEPEPVELYDVLSDPGEATNRAIEEREIVARLARLYSEIRQAPTVSEDSPARLSLEVQEKLVALGYLVGAGPVPDGERPDPREVVGVMAWIDGARGLALEGRVAASIEALEIFATAPVARALALRSLAPLYGLVGRVEDAVAAYATLAELTGGLETRVDLANAHLAAGRAEEALRTLDGVASVAPQTSPRLRLSRARTLLELDRVAEAEEEVAGVLEQDPGSDAAFALASRIRARRSGATAEIAHLKEFLERAADPRRLVETRAVLAELLHGEGRDREAVKLLEEAGEPAPEHRVILAGLAVARGNLERAVALYESVLAERPASQFYRRELADLYGQLGRVGEALRLYEELIAVHPEDAGLLVDRGATLFDAGRFTEAEADYRHALALDDKLPEAAFNLALIELSDGREAQAEKHLLQAVELRPGYAKAHFHLAQIYRKRGDPRAGLHAELAVQASASTTRGPLSQRRPPERVEASDPAEEGTRRP